MYNSKNTETSALSMGDLPGVTLSNDEFKLLMNSDSSLSADFENDAVVNNNFFKIAQAMDEVFLFISNNVFLSFEETCETRRSCIVANFYEAKSKLTQSFKPDLIVIDIPLKMSEFILFKSWLKSNGLQDIPIFYNDRFVQKTQIDILFVRKFVDDVIHLENDVNKLLNKAKFLKKIRLQTKLQAADSVSKNRQKKVRNGTMLMFDIGFALLIILCLIPIFILIALAIRLESKGPVFYTSLRTGVDFKIFKFYKFRTMVVDADKKKDELEELNIYSSQNDQVKFFKIKNDPRVTKVGSFLRNTSLDELPQLFNVVKGDMSIVGNRPLPVYEAITLTTNKWAERFMAPAGITGLWQISKRGNPEMSTEERLLLDIKYARNRSNIGDFKILVKTPFALRQKANV